MTLNEIQKILRDGNIKLGYQVDFPNYKILPEEVQLALKVLSRHGMRILITAEDLPKDTSV